MTVQDLKNIVKPFKEHFEVTYQEDPRDRIEYSNQGAVYIRIKDKESNRPIFSESGTFDLAHKDHPVVKGGYGCNNRSKEEAINDCCLKIMYNIIASGLWRAFEISKELRNEHGY